MTQEIPSEPGIYPDISDEDYFQSKRVSKSRLDHIGLAPNFRPDAYKFYFEHPEEERESSPIYHAHHAIVLRPSYFYEAFAVGKTRKKDIRNSINYADFEMAEALKAGLSRGVRTFLARAEHVECVCFYTCPITGIERKCKFDVLLKPEHRAIADLKQVSPDHLSDDRKLSDLILARGWHRQAYTYLQAANCVGYDVRSFVLLLQEDEPPYACRTVLLSQKYIELGARQVRAQIKMLKWYLDNDVWIAPHLEAPSEIDPPKWIQLTEGMING